MANGWWNEWTRGCVKPRRQGLEDGGMSLLSCQYFSFSSAGAMLAVALNVGMVLVKRLFVFGLSARELITVFVCLLSIL